MGREYVVISWEERCREVLRHLKNGSELINFQEQKQGTFHSFITAAVI